MSTLGTLRKQRWFQVLEQQRDKSSISDVARQMGYARSTISLVLSGKYDGGTDAIAAKTLATFTDFVTCPHLRREITNAECTDYHTRAMPMSDPEELRHWMKCRNECSHCPLTSEEESHA